MTKEKIVKFWKEESDKDLEMAEFLFKSKRYAYALFFCHLSIEKFLKALVARNTQSNAPYDHNLIRLSEMAGIRFSEKDYDMLAEINTFNIKARYDDYKTKFYKKATKEYAGKYIQETKRIILWLKKQ